MAFDYRNKYRKPVVGGAIQGVNRTGVEWAGVTNVVSQANNLSVISCSVVGSADAILLTTRVYGTETAIAGPFCVRSVNPGVGFTVSPVQSLAAAVSSMCVHWMVVKLA